MNIVLVGWNDTTSTVNTITDTRGNAYALAIGPSSGTNLRQSIYYAKNIAAGSNTVTVTFNQAAAFVDVRVLEYSGLDTASPLDVNAGAEGSGTSASSGLAATTAANWNYFRIAPYTGVIQRMGEHPHGSLPVYRLERSRFAADAFACR